MVVSPSDELRSLREARGLTLAEAAVRGGTTASSVSRWEAGRRTPRAPDLERYLKGLEAPARVAVRVLAATSANDRLASIPGVLGAPLGLGAALRAMRRRRGMTQAELARAAGVTQSAVAKWESGDSVPSAATVHALGFALGATPEETIALSRFQGGAPLEWTDPEDTVRRLDLLLATAGDLHETMVCGYEAEAWRRAARDPRWDPVLGWALSLRTVREYYEGRPGLGGAAAARALRLYRPQAICTMALHALDAHSFLNERRGGDPNETLAAANRFVETLPEGEFLGWARSIRAKSLARLGRRDEALAASERGIEATPQAGRTDGGHAWMKIGARVEVRLALGDARGALAAIDHAPGDVCDFPILIRARHANDLPAPDEWMRQARRHYQAWGNGLWLGRHRLKLLEDEQARLR